MSVQIGGKLSATRRQSWQTLDNFVGPTGREVMRSEVPHICKEEYGRQDFARKGVDFREALGAVSRYN